MGLACVRRWDARLATVLPGTCGEDPRSVEDTTQLHNHEKERNPRDEALVKSWMEKGDEAGSELSLPCIWQRATTADVSNMVKTASTRRLMQPPITGGWPFDC